MKLALLAGLLMSLGLIGILVCTILRVHEPYTPERIDYGILFDAGSTATKAYIYQWSHKTTKDVPFVAMAELKHGEPKSKEIHPGIASLSPNSTIVGDYLEPLLDWANKIIPKHAKSSTPIFLKGTGGLRQLSDFSSAALLTSVRYKLQDSGFYFENSFASVLSGVEEAAYGFIAVNALYDRFAVGESPLTTYGSLDMGGVSSEIAFISQSPPPANFSYITTINGTTYNIYAQSNDGLGINEARYQLNASLFLNTTGGGLVLDPCAPFGYYENVTILLDGTRRSFLLMGTSDSDSCQAQVAGLVQKLTYSHPKPPITGTFVVSDQYIKVKDFYKLQDNANILELEAKVYSFCGLSLDDAMAHHTHYADDVQKYCFMGSYIATLLRNYYGLDPAMRHILWKDTIKKIPVSWALGAMIDHVSSIAPDTSNPVTSRHVRFFRTDSGAVTLFISILVFVLGLVIFILQYRRSTDYVLIK